MKELNIIEASALINTEFEVIYPNGNKRRENVCCNLSGSLEEIGGGELYTYTDIINAKFIPIQKSVSFMEAIEAYSKGKTIKSIEEEDSQIFTHIYIPDGIADCIEDDTHSAMTAREILNGKWYIED